MSFLKQFLTLDLMQQAIRYGMQIVGTLLVADNVEAGQYWEAATSGLLNIVGAVWWLWANRRVATIAKVANLDEVRSVSVNDPALAKSVEAKAHHGTVKAA